MGPGEELQEAPRMMVVTQEEEHLEHIVSPPGQVGAHLVVVWAELVVGHQEGKVLAFCPIHHEEAVLLGPLVAALLLQGEAALEAQYPCEDCQEEVSHGVAASQECPLVAEP